MNQSKTLHIVEWDASKKLSKQYRQCWISLISKFSIWLCCHLRHGWLVYLLSFYPCPLSFVLSLSPFVLVRYISVCSMWTWHILDVITSSIYEIANEHYCRVAAGCSFSLSNNIKRHLIFCRYSDHLHRPMAILTSSKCMIFF